MICFFWPPNWLYGNQHLTKGALMWQISPLLLGEFHWRRSKQNVGEIEWANVCQKVCASEFSLGKKKFGEIDPRPWSLT